MKLYELSTQYTQLVDMLEQAQDNIETLEAIHDTLDAITDNIEIKADNIAKVMQQLKAEKEIIDTEAKRLADRGAKLQKQHDQLKAYLFENMSMIGADKIKTALFSFTIRNNPPSVNIIDETLIPQEFIKLTTSIDKKSIMEQLKGGQEVTGVALQQTKSLMIK